ncbi:MAG: ZIP family metal transporter [Thermoplasmata archaeon]
MSLDLSLPWMYSLLSVALVSILSVIGLVFISVREDKLRRMVLILVSFSAGALLGDAFIHLLPEAVEGGSFGMEISGGILFGILIFFVLEKFVHWHHCGAAEIGECPKAFATTNLVGDGLHNLIDGMIIAGSYLISVPLGIATTLAVLFHEIPQEIGDFGVLVHAGYTKKKALQYNFLSASAAIVGALLILLIGGQLPELSRHLLPFTAGAFIYIAGSDLIPELQKETQPGRSAFQLVGFLLGLLVMAGLVFVG